MTNVMTCGIVYKVTKGPIMDYTKRPKPAHKYPDWYADRDKQVYLDRESGSTWRSLVDKYKVSETYLKTIYDKQSNKLKKGK